MFTCSNNDVCSGIFSLFGRGFFSGGGISSTNLRFVSTNSTITPSITLSGGSPDPLWHVTESTGITYVYTTTSFSHTKTAGTGNLTVQLMNTYNLKNYVTAVTFITEGIISSFRDLQIEKFVNLTDLNLRDNSLIGDLTTLVLPSNLLYLQLQDNTLTGNLSSLNIPSSTITFQLHNNNFSGNIASWSLPSTLVTFQIQNNSFSGDVSSWTLSSSLNLFYIYLNNLSGDLSSITLPATVQYCQLRNNSFTGGPRISVASTPLEVFRIDSNLLGQAAVDQICLDAYNNRVNFTAATPTFNVDGTGNSTPSGTYQDGDPPTTGKEYIYELVNDPESEGFNTHVWTYN